MPNYYEILGVAQAATPEEIKNSYKKLALKWHPDKNLDNKEEAEKRFKEINDSYQILINSESRAIYDDRGESWREFLKMETYSSEELRKKDKEKRFQKTVQETTMLIFSEFASHSQIGEEDLDPSLWNGYSDWLEKVQSLKDSDSLLFFWKTID